MEEEEEEEEKEKEEVHVANRHRIAKALLERKHGHNNKVRCASYIAFIRFQYINVIPFFNAFILRNNIPCDKLRKSFGMWYSTSYADLGIKMRDHILTAPRHSCHLGGRPSNLSIRTGPNIA
jgi:hypothetical protein